MEEAEEETNLGSLVVGEMSLPSRSANSWSKRLKLLSDPDAPS